MKRVLPLLIILTLLIPAGASAAPSAAPVHGVNPEVTIPNDGPTFWVHDVQRNKTVTISVTNYPGDRTYQVLIGRVGNAFGQGVPIGLLDGSYGKEFRVTFDIPNQFHGEQLLGIKLRRNADGSQGYNIFANIDDWNSTKPLSISPVNQASSQTVGTSASIFMGPTYWVHDVVPNKQFTLKFTGFEGNDRFKVYVGQNTSDFNEAFVGTVLENNNWTFTQTFDYPSRVLGLSEIKVLVVSNYTGHSGATAFTNQKDWSVITPWGLYDEAWLNSFAQSGTSGSPYTNIINVVQNGEVTLQTFNFPEDTNFVVTMGPMGTQGIGGIVIGTQNSGGGGSFIATYPIPGQLHGQETIAIRMESVTTTHFTYDFFDNVDGYSYISYGTAFAGDWILPPGTYPSTLINSVDRDVSVTISGFNFTKNDTYTVTMGPMGTQGVGGVVVGNIYLSGTGTFTQTFNIPAALVGQSQISIRFQSHNSDYYAYDWFWNQ